MRTYASSRVKRKSFRRKSELQMFLLISGGHIGGQLPCEQSFCRGALAATLPKAGSGIQTLLSFPGATGGGRALL